MTHLDRDVGEREDLANLARAEAIRSGLIRLPLPTSALDLEGEPTSRWTPSTTNDLDEAVLTVLPRAGSPYAFEHQLAKAQLRELPQSLRAIVGRLRTDTLRLQVLEWVEARIESEAIEASNFKVGRGWSGSLQTTAYVPAIWRRRILRALAASPEFVRDLRQNVEDAIADAHDMRSWSDWPRPLPAAVPTATLPSSGAIVVDSWVGLGSETLPEAAPEALLMTLARRAWRPYRHAAQARGRKVVGWALHWGAMAGSFGIALMATAPLGFRWNLSEIDTIGSPRSLPWVRWRSDRLPTSHDLPTLRPYRFALVHVPPPGDGANQIRNRLKDLGTHEDMQRRLQDVGRLGPHKWRRAVARSIKEVMSSLDPQGELALLLPTAQRVNQGTTGTNGWGYEHDASLLEGLTKILESGGLQAVVDIEVTEKNAVSVPFFGLARCPWRLLIARPHRQPDLEDDQESREDLEDLLRSLEVDT